MQKNINANRVSVKFIVHGLAAWAITALTLLLLTAFILSRVNAGSKVLAYASSAISFIAAMAAGATAAAERGQGRLISGAAIATVAAVVLLFLGFVISSEGLSPDGVLSVVMFTYAGAAFGSIFIPIRSKKDKLRRAKKHGVKG